jgi:hypothetical protein
MFAEIGGAVGVLFCLYSIMFRWKAVTAKYGRFSLYWWALAVTAVCSLIGYLIGWAVWGVLYLFAR